MKPGIRHKSIETFHFTLALNVIMILLVFVIVIFASLHRYGVRIKYTETNMNTATAGNETIVLNVDTDKMQLAGRTISLADLPAELKRLKKSKNLDFIIQPTASAKINFVRNIISSLKNNGINNVTLQTDLASF